MAEDVIELKNIRKDWYDQGSDLVNVHIYVKDVDDLKIDYKEKQVTLDFYTRHTKFLKEHGHGRRSSNHFSYKIYPREEIDSSNCKHIVKAPYIELILKKSVPKKWDSLEVPTTLTAKSKKKNGKGNPASPEGKSASPKKGYQLLGGKSTPLAKKGCDDAKQDGETKVENLPSTSKPSTVDKRNIQKMAGAHAQTEIFTGLTGLENYANNCYMNVVIQLLANIQELRDYLKTDLFVKDINTNNPLCSGGKVVKAFAEVTKALWSHRKHAFKPSDLKNIMGKRCSLFLGWQQHDAQEFFASLLDNLHEDLNQFYPEKNGDKDKAKTDCESNDNEKPDTAWHSHIKRNNSFIVKLFHGQLMSKVTCHACHKVSYSYDPCAQISLPIPSSKQTIQVLFFTRDITSPPQLIKLQVSTVNAKLWHLVNMLQTVKKTPAHLISLFKGVSDVYTDLLSPLSSVLKHKFIIASEVTAKEEPDHFSIPVFQHLLHAKVFVNCDNCLKSQEEDIGGKLKRCTRCMATAYCSRDCQMKHWSSSHNKVCCKDLKMQVGLPFYVTVRRDVSSYDAFEELLRERAKISVESVDDNVNEGESQDAGQAAESEAGAENKGKTPSSQSPNCKYVVKLATKMNVNDESCTVLNGDNFSTEWIAKSPCLIIEWQNSTTDGDNKNKDEIHTKKVPTHEVCESECFGASSSSDQFSLYDCLKLFMEPERLDESESWKCPKCTSLQSAKKEMTISSPPWFLLLHLKRFTYGDSGQKIHKAIHYPLSNLDLSPYIAKETRSKFDHQPIYDLCGVITHRGNMRMGHYTCMVRMMNQSDQEEVGWRHFDDDCATKIKNEKVVSQDAYVLMYRIRGAHNAIRLERYSNALNSASSQDNSSASVSKRKRADSVSGKFSSANGDRRSASEYTFGVNLKRSASIESSNDGNTRKKSEADTFPSPLAARRCTSAIPTENYSKNKEMIWNKNFTSTSMPNVSIEGGNPLLNSDSSFDELNSKTTLDKADDNIFVSNESLGSFENLTINDVVAETEATIIYSNTDKESDSKDETSNSNLDLSSVNENDLD